MAEGKKSVPFVTILENVSLQKYWSTDENKVFDLHGLQASEGFNSTNSETVKSFPPSHYWINLKLRCLFVNLLFLQSASKCGCFSILWPYFWKYCYLFCTLQNKHGREASKSCWNCGLNAMEGKTCTDLKGQRWHLLVLEGWRVGLCFGVVFIRSADQQRSFMQQKVVCRGSQEGSVSLTMKIYNFV